MKNRLKWSITSAAIIITGTLSGCATGHGMSASANTTNPSHNSTSGLQRKTATTALTSNALTMSNILSVRIESAQSMSVNGSTFSPPKLIHGVLEPIVATIQFGNLRTPLSLKVNNLMLNNPSSPAGGGFDYYTYNGTTFKVNRKLPGNFPVSNTLVLRQNSTVTFVGTTGTPTPSTVDVQLMYKDSKIGSFPVSNQGTLAFENGSVKVVSTPPQSANWSSIVKESMQYILSRTDIPLLAPTVPTYAPTPYGTLRRMDAQVSASPTSYNVYLQWANKTLPLNSPALKQPPNTGLAAVIGGFGAKVYSTPQVAEAQLKVPQRGIDPAYVQPPTNEPATPVDLGHGILGTLYKSQFDPIVQWHEGEWTIQVTDTKAQYDIQVAKKLVAYFNTALLPETKGVFGVNVAGDGDHTSAQWVFGDVVYTCSDYHSALQAAKMAASMRAYPSGQRTPSSIQSVSFAYDIKFPANSTVPISGAGPGGNSAPLGTLTTGTRGWIKGPNQPGWSYVIGSGSSQVVVVNLPVGPQLSGIPNNTSYVITGHPSNHSGANIELASGSTLDGYIAIPDKPGWDITMTYRVGGSSHVVQIRIKA
ncbi:hypothetical protein [Alicyclobacillus mengziensis]|uniref:Uncharacterized protein n=1 Tax=Alicyclobacillus mengziensis TaxID=2931921 RepID=A0A9X7VVW7_9BACL|nr:hypothetical protein [Alicyclobacillus mengziensis]QSO45570.1 hypothetical protein JZ786_13415 [Alicyclobacillus mengziensis]